MRMSSSIAMGAVTALSLALGATSLTAQLGTTDGQWRSFAGDLGSTRYAPLDQIDAENFSSLEVAWVLDPDNFGPTFDSNYQTTPLMVDGVLYATAGSRRNVVALDATTGELLWMYRLDEGQRADNAIRNQSGRGVAYWTDGEGDERIYHVTIGYQLVALDAKTGRPVQSFGRNGIVDLKLDDDQEIDPMTGEIGWNSAPIVARDVVLIGASHRSGGTPPSMRNVKGFVRAFDVRTGQRKWIFHTIPMEGELGWDTWEQGSAEYTGNTGVWTTFTVDAENGIAYLPVEIPTGDYVGVHRPGSNLFGESLIAVDLETGERIWHFQLVHHPLWDYDIPAPPILADITVGGRRIQAVAQPSKQGFLYVFDRLTGVPVWPIEERPVPRGSVPGEWYSPTQPFPTKPPPFERQGFELSEILDLTPELRAEALEVASQVKTGPLFTPPIVRGDGGKLGTIFIANGSNWPGGAFDPETGMLYVYSQSQLRVIGLTNDHPASRSDMAYLAGAGGASMEVQGLPIIKPPWGRITAYDLNRGEIAWQVAHGDTPDFVMNHPALRGVNVPRTGKIADAGGSSGGIGTLVTRTLVISGEGSAPADGVYGGPETGRAAKLFAYDKATGREVGAVEIPSMQTGSPMTYMVDGKQYIVVATGGGDNHGRLIAFTLP